MSEVQRNHSLTFRPAGPEDIMFINKLMREGKAYWGYSEEGVERFMQSYAIPDGGYFDTNFGFVAEMDHDAVGFYLFTSEAYLDYFLLSTRFIGRGYGRLLWEHCVQQAQQKGWEAFTFVSDPYARGFYERMGATTIGEMPMVTLPGCMAPKMQFTLAEMPHSGHG